jgi:hypothetical protein
MKMALPKDVPTLEAKATKNLICPDNVFCSTGLLEHFVTCNTEPAWRPINTNHFPIISVIDITPSSKDFTPRPSYKETEWNDFRESLKAELGQIPDPETYNNIDELRQAIKHIDKAINNCMEKHVPLSKLCPALKRWWSGELAEARKGVTKLGRMSYRKRAMQDHPIHEEFCMVRNTYLLQIRKTKAKEWLEKLDGLSMWTASRLVMGPATDGGRSRIPTLQMKHPMSRQVIREATTNKEKGEWLLKSSFLPNLLYPQLTQTTSIPNPHGSTNQSPTSVL